MAEIAVKQREITKAEFNSLVRPIWNYMAAPGLAVKDRMALAKLRSDVVVTLGSSDTLPVYRAAEYYHAGISDTVMFTGKGGSYKDQELGTDITEARMFANKAITLGVPEKDIIIEQESTNTGQNCTFTAEMLRGKGKSVEVMDLCHMPSSLMRDLAAWLKQYPTPQPLFLMTGPEVDCAIYHVEGFSGQLSREKMVNSLMGDFQRMYVYADKGYQTDIARQGLDYGPYRIPPVSDTVKQSYLELVGLGYGGDNLIKDATGSAQKIF